MSDERTCCLHCREPIREGARRCPSCQSWQSRWAADSQNPRLEVAVVVVGAIILASLVFGWALSHGEQPETAGVDPGYQSLVVTNVECFPLREDTYNYVTVVGEVANPTAVAYTNLFFYVRFFNAAGELIDASSPRDYALVVPPGGAARFKLVDRWLTHELSDYVRCEVDVTWAKTVD